MAAETLIPLKDAIYTIQHSLLDGINHEDQLFAAGTLLSRSDYDDAVTERTISGLCGYPLCNNQLPSDRPIKGRYKISLKEHKVYDLTETYLYCSSKCGGSSKAFSESLKSERCSVSDYDRISEVLRLFNDLSLDSGKKKEKKERSGFSSKLKIHEKLDVSADEISSEYWIGRESAIEGYVPQSDRHYQDHKEGSRNAKFTLEKGTAGSEGNFTSTIIVEDPIKLHKTPSRKERHSDRVKNSQTATISGVAGNETNFMSTVIVGDEIRPKKISDKKDRHSDLGVEHSQGELDVRTNSKPKETNLKSSLKSSKSKTLNRSVTWSDELKVDNVDGGGVSNSQMVEVEPEGSKNLDILKAKDHESSLRLASAEACAVALSEAADAVTAGKFDVSDAVSEAGILIISHENVTEEGNPQKALDMVETEQAGMKWPSKPSFSYSEMFDPDDSWFDSPPEGFSLTLSSFSTIWMALFGWITSSSLAYIYGKDESAADEFLFVNGREYPCKIVLGDGRSAEIRRTLDGCIARALPGLVTNLRLPTPSTLEQAMGLLLNTMSYTDALPPFKTKQWHTVILLFLDVLSVHRLPALAPYMTSRGMLLHKVLNAAELSIEEYEAMRDLFLPLGRLPQFSVQNGG